MSGAKTCAAGGSSGNSTTGKRCSDDQSGICDDLKGRMVRLLLPSVPFSRPLPCRMYHHDDVVIIVTVFVQHSHMIIFLLRTTTLKETRVVAMDKRLVAKGSWTLS